jgi:hypothetical protein
MEDRGYYDEATKFYGKALQLDPKYTQAQNKLKTNRLLSTTVQMSMPGPGFKPPVPSEAVSAPNVVNRGNMIDHRLQTVNQNIGSTYVPGLDTRKSSEEYINSSTSISSDTRTNDLFQISDVNFRETFTTTILGDLPLPPEPPRGP